MNGRLVDLIRPSRLTAVVDVGANPIDGVPPYASMLAAGLCSVAGFEPQERALAKLRASAGPNERYFGTAVGDGSVKTLHVTHCEGMSSTLKPDAGALAAFVALSDYGRVVETLPVKTYRLDDLDIGPCDFLKIDVQGGEMDVFRYGRDKLAEAVAIQTEVSFITLYEDQPPIGVVDTWLRAQGFVPHLVAEQKPWPIGPLQYDPDPRVAFRQIMEMDLVYVRDFTRDDSMTAEQWKHLAMIALCVYGSIDLVGRCVAALERLGAVPAGSLEQFRALIAPHIHAKAA